VKRMNIHLPHDAGDRLADGAVKALGNWNFILIQAALLFLWFLLNSVGWFYHWDSYPFTLCNLFMSAEAAFSSPLILMSQNRQAGKDRARDTIEAAEVEKMYETNALLLKINHQQLQILELLKEQHYEGNRQ